MHFPSDLHSQRPEYQRENIELALKIVLGVMKELGIDDKEYDPNNIRYVDLMGENAGVTDATGKIEIDFRFGFNTKVMIHEVFHGYSTDMGYGRKSKYTTRCGYHLQALSNDNKRLSHYRGFNEGLTNLLTLDSIQSNFEEIKILRTKYRKLMLQHRDLWKKSGDPYYDTFNSGCKNTGWFRSYYREMQLVNIIIDLVAYQRSRKGGELEEHKDSIWTDLVIGYFVGDYKILRSLLKEADSTGLLKSHIQDLQPYGLGVEEITKSIRQHVRDTFDSKFRMKSIPKK